MAMITVLLVDDHPMMRESMRMAIDVEPDMQVIGEAANGVQAVQRALELAPNCTVMDLFLPLKDGVTAIAEITAQNPRARILAMTSAVDDSQVVAAIQAGALGYLLKAASRDQFVQGVRTVARGRRFLPPDVAEKLANGLRQERISQLFQPPAPHTATGVEALTPRQQEILALLGQGLSNQAIAETLVISESTVRVHIHHILDRLDLDDRNQAIIYALSHLRA